MIQKISESSKQAILRKTPYAHGTRPSDEGMGAQQVKRLFYTAIADDTHSVMAEMERMRQEANRDIDTKTDVAMQTDDVEGAVDSHHYPSTLGMQRYMDKVGNIFRLYFTDLVVPDTRWQALETPLGDYTHVARISLPNVTGAMVPDVYFAPADVARPQLATFAYCEDGAVALYATQALQGDLRVQTLICSLPSCYSVLVSASHATVTIVDARAKSYAHGDVVAIGETLHVTVSPEEGYEIVSATLCGSPIGEGADVVVQGTVQVEVVTQQGGGV